MSPFLLILAVVALVVSTAAAYFHGVQRGKALGHNTSKAVGWMEHYNQTIAHEKARRDARGRFRSRMEQGNEVGA